MPFRSGRYVREELRNTGHIYEVCFDIDTALQVRRQKKAL